MKKARQQELRALSQRLCAKGTDHSPNSGGTIERYTHLAEQLGHSPALNDALVERTIQLMQQSRYCEALGLFENRLAETPDDLGAQANWRRALHDIHERMLKLAETEPESAEFGRTYERLLQVGHVGIRLHLGAVLHYLASGNPDRAVDRLVLLAQLSPGAPGVQEAISRASALSDDARLVQLKTNLERNDS